MVIRKVLAHTGPFTNKDKEHKGSSYNVLIEWENGDITEEPLNWMIKENAMPIAQYVKEKDLLDTPGWKLFGRWARHQAQDVCANP